MSRLRTAAGSEGHSLEPGGDPIDAVNGLVANGCKIRLQVREEDHEEARRVLAEPGDQQG